MKILLVGDYWSDPTQGSSKVYDKVASALGQRGHQVTVWRREQIGLRPAQRHLREMFATWLVWLKILREFSRYRWDVIEITSGEGLIWGAWHGLWRLKSVFVSRSHGLEHLNYRRMVEDHRVGWQRRAWWKNWWYPLMRMRQVARAAQLADGMIVLNERGFRFVVEEGWKAADRVQIIPHGIADIFLQEPPAWRDRAGDILFCGSWNLVKGTPIVVEAFTRLARLDPSRRLTIVGADDAALVRREFPRELWDRITIHLHLQEEEVLQEYRKHRIFVFASTYEGFGLTLLEAMSQGLAVVATEVGVAARLVRHEETGLLIALRDVAALVTAWQRLSADARWAADLGSAAREASKSWTWEKTAIETESFYKHLARKNRVELA
jgi:glycosyltransferase involved in cell wall biosynthesis